MFTIENHLEVLSHTDENCKTIYSIWNLNKKNLKRALSTIQITFPHYSIHDYSHADTIIQNIELYLGESRIKTLSVTDAWLILMSAYTHDIGMIVFMKDLEDKINSDEFKVDLELKAHNKYDYDLAEAAKLMLRLLSKEINKDDFNISYALEIKRAITLLSADLFRKIHHEQSKKILQGMNESFANEFNKFYSNDIPVRFLQVLGDIAYSHGIDFYETMDLLPQKSNGYASDYMHPRFVAYMLRLGDLLDVDDKRFNQFTTKVFDKDKVKLSEQHEVKHASVRHLLVTPESIEVTVDCKEDETVYRIANQWFDYLKGEIENQSREWSKIRPPYLAGLAPSFSRNKIQVLFNGKMADTDLMNLQFNISKEKTFEIFEGSALYDDPSFVFLREITQNAVDATKIQLWKDIEKGVYDVLIKRHFENVYGIETQTWEHDEIMQNIVFPTDIPSEIHENYEIKFSIDWETIKNQEYLVIQVKDKGCGINKATLIRMCRNVGDSRINDHQFQDLKARMPFFLKPTGAFGLGLQSIFLVTDEFAVETKNEDDKGWDIIFRSAKRGQYISAIQASEKRSTGTSLIIKIPKSKLPQLFPDDDEDELNDYYDFFNDLTGSPVIWKMIFFSRNFLLKQQFLKLYVFGSILDIDKFKPDPSVPIERIISFQQLFNERSVSNKLLITIGIFEISENRYLNSTTFHLGFKIFEHMNEKSGTEINIIFLDTFNLNISSRYYRVPFFSYLFSVRDINIDDDFRNFNETIYSRLNINFLNPESDKILNIARNKLIKKTKDEFKLIFINKLLKSILPQIKRVFERNFEDLYKNVLINDSLSEIYFHMQLTFLINELNDDEYRFDNSFYKDLLLPKETIAIYPTSFRSAKLAPVTDFFEQNYLFINQLQHREIRNVLGLETQPFDRYYEYETIEYFEKSYNVIIKNKKNARLFNVPIIWYPDYLNQYLNEKFVIKSFLIDTKHRIIYGIEVVRKTINKYPNIELSQEEKAVYFENYFHNSNIQRSGRESFHPLTPYAADIAIRNYNHPGATFHSYTEHQILSPFVDYKAFSEMRQELKELIDSKDNLEIKNNLKNRYIDFLINDKIIQYIIDNASIAVSPNATSIKNSYINLITDLLILSPATTNEMEF